MIALELTDGVNLLEIILHMGVFNLYTCIKLI